MKRIKKAIKEINKLLRRVDNFTVLLKAFVILTVSYLIFFMIGIQPYYAFVPAIVYIFSSLVIAKRIDQVLKVETKYRDLYEKLRTARDYQSVDNSLLEVLEEDVLFNLKKVRLTSFFSFSKTVLLVSLLIVAVSTSLYIASENMQIIDVNTLIETAVGGLTPTINTTSDEADFTGGEESIMKVGNERIEVEINPVGIDFDFNDVEEHPEYDFTKVFPKEVFISSAAAAENEFTEEQQQLIKSYFEKKKNK